MFNTEDEAVTKRFDAEFRLYVDLRAEAEAAEAEAKKKNRALEDQKFRLWDFLESAGMKTVNHELGKVTRGNRMVANVADEALLYHWLDAAGLINSMTKRTFRKKELNALVKEHVESGEELPEGVEPLLLKTITFTKQK